MMTFTQQCTPYIEYIIEKKYITYIEYIIEKKYITYIEYTLPCKSLRSCVIFARNSKCNTF